MLALFGAFAEALLPPAVETGRWATGARCPTWHSGSCVLRGVTASTIELGKQKRWESLEHGVGETSEKSNRFSQPRGKHRIP